MEKNRASVTITNERDIVVRENGKIVEKFLATNRKDAYAKAYLLANHHKNSDGQRAVITIYKNEE